MTRAHSPRIEGRACESGCAEGMIIAHVDVTRQYLSSQPIITTVRTRLVKTFVVPVASDSSFACTAGAATARKATTV